MLKWPCGCSDMCTGMNHILLSSICCCKKKKSLLQKLGAEPFRPFIYLWDTNVSLVDWAGHGSTVNVYGGLETASMSQWL